MSNAKWLVGLLLMAAAVTAHAHAHLKSAVPADGSTVKESPQHIMLTFSEAARVTALTVQKESGPEQKLTPLPTTASDHVMIPAPKLAAGKYTVNYRVVSDDNHVMSGKISFTVADVEPTSSAASHDHDHK